jgi:hypothetical protein
VQTSQLAGLKALELGWWGISKVRKLTDMDYETIKKDIVRSVIGNTYVNPCNMPHLTGS